MSKAGERMDVQERTGWVRVALTQTVLLLLAAITISGFASWSRSMVPREAGHPGSRVEGMELTRLRVERATQVLTYAGKYHIPTDLSAAIYDIALDEGIHPALAFRLVKVESGFQRQARSPRGAVGYTQVRLATARGYEPRLTEEELQQRDLNLRLGFRFLKDLLERFDNRLDLALLAYNRGPTLVDSLLTIGEDPSNGYSDVVMRGLQRAVREAPQGVRRGS